MAYANFTDSGHLDISVTNPSVATSAFTKKFQDFYTNADKNQYCDTVNVNNYIDFNFVNCYHHCYHLYYTKICLFKDFISSASKKETITPIQDDVCVTDTNYYYLSGTQSTVTTTATTTPMRQTTNNASKLQLGVFYIFLVNLALVNFLL